MLLRYIIAYHYEVFQKLENVSREIIFEVKSKKEKNLKAFARKDMKKDALFKATSAFIEFYQKKFAKMHREDVPKPSPIDMNVISEARIRFSVFIDLPQESDKMTVYGEKTQMEEALSFLKIKISGDPSASTMRPVGDTTTARVKEGETRAEISLGEKLSCDLPKNVKLVVYQGDLAKERADTIVSPVTARLEQSDGVAAAVVKAGGKSIQNECYQIMRQRHNKPFNVGEATKTGSGILPCTFVVHAVVPIWNDHSPNVAKQLLFDTVWNSLYLSCNYAAKSISIPAISSGLYGVPVAVCAEVLFDAVTMFLQNVATIPLNEIRFVNIDFLTNRTFAQEMEKRYGSYIKREKVEALPQINDKGQERCTENLTNFCKHPESSISGKCADSNTPKALLTYAGAVAVKKDSKPGAESVTTKVDECSICLSTFAKKKTLDKCGHSFCTDCIDKAFKMTKKCPVCGLVYGSLTGNQPKGNMHDSFQATSLLGFGSCGTIVISYRFNGGTQGPNHPNPGKPYKGTNQTAYLPNNEEGKKVLKLLRKAFDQKLTFTIGRSSTTGDEDVITWNGIHHKTSRYGGPTCFGYPDPDYLRRVQDELAEKGITE